jgi:predicted  nucleic acid-binding Zn-ribbon protein
VQLEQVINHANDPISAASIIEEARKAIAETETALEAIKKEISSHRSKIEAANKNQSVSISSQGQVSKFKNAIAKAALNAGKQYSI